MESVLLNASEDAGWRQQQWTRSARNSVRSSALAMAKPPSGAAPPLAASVHSTPRLQQLCHPVVIGTPMTMSALTTARAALEPLFVNEAFSGSAEGSGAGVRISPPYVDLDADADTDATLAYEYVRTWPRQRSAAAGAATSTAAAIAASTNATPSMTMAAAGYAPPPRGALAESTGTSTGITADALNAQRRLLRNHSSRKRSRPALLANAQLVNYAGAPNDLRGFLYTPTGSTVCSTLVCETTVPASAVTCCLLWWWWLWLLILYSILKCNR